MLIGELLELLHRRATGERWEGDMALQQRFTKAEARKITLLWLRAKTGYNQFVEAMGGRIGHGACAGQAEATGRDDRLNALEPIDESQPLWRFLTTHSDVDKAAAAGDCLFVVISRMTEKHNEFLQELREYGVEVSDKETLKPLELERVSLGDVRPWVDLRLNLQHEEADLKTAEVKMLTQLETSLLRLDQMGTFAQIVQRHWRDDTASFDLVAISHEVRDTFLRKLVPIADPANVQHLRRVFRFRQVSATAGEASMMVERLELELSRAFEGSGAGPSGTNEANYSLFFNMFHSLEQSGASQRACASQAGGLTALRSLDPGRYCPEALGERLTTATMPEATSLLLHHQARAAARAAAGARHCHLARGADAERHQDA